MYHYIMLKQIVFPAIIYLTKLLVGIINHFDLKNVFIDF